MKLFLIIFFCFNIFNFLLFAKQDDRIKDAFKDGLITKQLYETITKDEIKTNTLNSNNDFFKQSNSINRVNSKILDEIIEKEKSKLLENRNKMIELFNEALSYHKEKKYLQAIDTYNLFISNYPSSSKSADSKYLIGACYEELNNFTLAIKAYEDMNINYFSSDFNSTAFLRIAICFDKMEKYHDAISKYDLFLKKHPTSKWTPFAKERIEYLKRVL